MIQKIFDNIDDWVDFEKNRNPKFIYDRLRGSHIASAQRSFGNFKIKSFDKIFIRQYKDKFNNTIQRTIVIFYGYDLNNAENI